MLPCCCLLALLLYLLKPKSQYVLCVAHHEGPWAVNPGHHNSYRQRANLFDSGENERGVFVLKLWEAVAGFIAMTVKVEFGEIYLI
ncbi:hypothetical protein XELAEV_18044595mg [Xenopus laevis]|uniref:Secreted protein n=1 Tax=Xenopus laevis TaxID=8355 RepID=A0A974H3U9_XENLA|nr:hypothetical protein XELAEV_18044595mg [Xenopus laevis]